MSIDSDVLSLLLSRRRTALELKQALQKKEYEKEEIEDAVARWREKGYIDHADYARRFVHDAIHLKGHGPERIRRDLKQRGVEEYIIAEALTEQDFGLKSQMSARFGEGKEIDRKTADKITRFFLYRGFPEYEIRKTLRELYTFYEE